MLKIRPGRLRNLRSEHHGGCNQSSLGPTPGIPQAHIQKDSPGSCWTLSKSRIWHKSHPSRVVQQGTPWALLYTLISDCSIKRSKYLGIQRIQNNFWCVFYSQRSSYLPDKLTRWWTGVQQAEDKVIPEANHALWHLYQPPAFTQEIERKLGLTMESVRTAEEVSSEKKWWARSGIGKKKTEILDKNLLQLSP